MSPINGACWVSLCDSRSAVEIESGLISTLVFVFSVVFLNISTILALEFSHWSVLLVIGKVPEVNIIRFNVEVEAISFLGILDVDPIHELCSFSLGELIGDRLDCIVLV